MARVVVCEQTGLTACQQHELSCPSPPSLPMMKTTCAIHVTRSTSSHLVVLPVDVEAAAEGFKDGCPCQFLLLSLSRDSISHFSSAISFVDDLEHPCSAIDQLSQLLRSQSQHCREFAEPARFNKDRREFVLMSNRLVDDERITWVILHEDRAKKGHLAVGPFFLDRIFHVTIIPWEKRSMIMVDHIRDASAR